ncbi:G2-specific serine/threonine protein kinase, partial [Ascosphaera atra]
TKNVSGSSGNSSASASGSGSGSGSEEDEFPSTTELSALTLNSPPVNKRIDPIKEISRTPFSSKTKTVVSSPYDVDMAEPSPMKIDDMSLSPMRKSNFIARRDTVVFSDDEDDETEDVPSPSRPKFTRAPQRPLMRAKTTSSMARLAMAQTNMAKQDGRQNSLTNATSHSDLQSNHQESQDHSPVRRNKTTPANPGVGSPLRRVPNNRPPANRAYTAGGEGMLKAALQRNMGGRTLVELSQARAGGRPIEEVKPKNNQNMPPPARSAHPAGGAGSVTAFPPVVWDPETVEDMPSPFLIKSKIIRNLR